MKLYEQRKGGSNSGAKLEAFWSKKNLKLYFQGAKCTKQKSEE